MSESTSLCPCRACHFAYRSAAEFPSEGLSLLPVWDLTCSKVTFAPNFSFGSMARRVARRYGLAEHLSRLMLCGFDLASVTACMQLILSDGMCTLTGVGGDLTDLFIAAISAMWLLLCEIDQRNPVPPRGPCGGYRQSLLPERHPMVCLCRLIHLYIVWLL